MSAIAKRITKPTTQEVASEVVPVLFSRPLYRFTVEQYRRLVENDILTKDNRAELLDGWIVHKMTHYPPHDATISLVQIELGSRLSSDWLLRIQSASNTADSEPEPDVAAVRGPARRYVKAHPKPRDIGMLVEVADSSLEGDRVFKGMLYARARIPVYWIVNLRDAQVEVYTHPKGGKSAVYTQRRDYGIEESVPLVLDGREIARIPVHDLLP